MTSISTTRLTCGAALLVEEMSSVRSAAVVLAVPAGHGEDPPQRQGMAALWSEMLLRGCGGRDSKQDADYSDYLGFTRGVNSGTYYMTFSITLLAEKLPDALRLIADMALHPMFDASGIEPSRELALAEIAALKDDPQERCLLAAKRRHHPAPFNQSGLGTTDGLHSITHVEVIEHWRARCLPQRSILAIAGAVRATDGVALAESAFAGWSGSGSEFTPGHAAERGYAHEVDQSNQVQIVLMHDAPPDNAAHQRDTWLEKVVVSTLSGGMAGRLFSEVREKRGLCYSVSASYRGDREYGVCLAYVGTTPERAQQSLDVLREQLAFINTLAGRITPEEFSRAIIGMKTGVVFAGESTGARASGLVIDQHRVGRPRPLEEIAATIDSITLDEVNAYLARRSLGTVTIQTLGPQELKV